MVNARSRPILSDEIIARCGERASAYDRENRFFAEDFEELRKAGYLKMAVPKERRAAESQFPVGKWMLMPSFCSCSRIHWNRSYLEISIGPS